MIQDLTESCSPYLSRPNRDLSSACAEISRARGLAQTPCGSCSLTAICRGPDLANVMPLCQPRPVVRYPAAARRQSNPPAHAA